MRKIPLSLALIISLTSLALWLDHYFNSHYNLTYPEDTFGLILNALIVLVPAVCLSTSLVLLSVRKRWMTWFAGILLIPTAVLWWFSISLMLNDFKIH